MLLLTHAAATFTMLGVIWVVQLVHYPLFRHVGADGYKTYQAEHMHRITWIVAPVMTIELGTALALAVMPPSGVPTWMAWSGGGLLAFIWGITGLVHVPLHSRLTDGFDAAVHRRLVRTNWLRTAAWTLRGALAVGMLAPPLS